MFTFALIETTSFNMSKKNREEGGLDRANMCFT